MTIHIWRLKVCKQFNLPLFLFSRRQKIRVAKKSVVAFFRTWWMCESRANSILEFLTLLEQQRFFHHSI
jgi:hypothetical protein